MNKNKKQKFENFLESLKGNGQDTLIESVKQGFNVCFEGSGYKWKEASTGKCENCNKEKKLNSDGWCKPCEDWDLKGYKDEQRTDAQFHDSRKIIR